MIVVFDHRTDRAPGENAGCAEPGAVVRLRPLLVAAASTDLDDHETWTAIIGLAHRVTLELHARGELPAHLTVAHQDAPVLVTRTIAAAWRLVTGSPTRVPPRRDDG